MGTEKKLGFIKMDKATLVEKINVLRKEKKAIILAHNYQIPDIQDIADFTGDSLDLATKATKTDAEVIIFCGVNFMAESAKILNPEKTVILPDANANCPMAAMVDVQSLKCKKEDYPDAEVVAYINTTADVKAISDICCTSSNGAKVVNSVKAKEVIFVPDNNLGSYIQRFIKDKKMILWQGICSTHHNIKKQELLNLKEKHPKAEIIVHPECRLEVIDISDQALSTNGMISYCKKSSSKEFIIGTEKDMCYRLKKEIPGKTFIPVESAVCINMKKNTLEKVLNSLETLEPKVELSNEIMKKAKIPLQRMMDIGRGD